MSSDSDPTPPLILRVAVTGHRCLVNEAAVRASAGEVLRQIADIEKNLASGYSAAPPSLRILSSLAEGSDRIVAEEALALRNFHAVTLECPLPAAREVYREDFKTPESREVFDDLLCQASAVFELDGQRRGDWLRSSDYAQAGHVAAMNCDILIAIWDGKPGKEGGTAEIAKKAMDAGIPMLRIDPGEPGNIALCASHNRWESDWRTALGQTLQSMLKAPKSAADWLSRYANEKPGADSGDDLRPDLLAQHYGNLYRVSYRLKYGLSALAVGFAVGGLIRESGLWPALELAAIGGILLCFLLAYLGHWHERWLDYRLLAEQFRVLRFLQPLGEPVPVFRAPRYWGVPTERHSCVRWYFRAWQRKTSLPNAPVDADYVNDRRSEVLEAATGQFDYHERKHKRVELGHHIMEWGAVISFGLTAIACAIHLSRWASAIVLGAITATLPAFGAAMEGLQAQEEGRRIAGNARAMAKHLADVRKRIVDLPPDAGLEALAGIAVELATEMTRETSGWHNLIHVQKPKV